MYKEVNRYNKDRSYIHTILSHLIERKKASRQFVHPICSKIVITNKDKFLVQFNRLTYPTCMTRGAIRSLYHPLSSRKSGNQTADQSKQVRHEVAVNRRRNSRIDMLTAAKCHLIERKGQASSAHILVLLDGARRKDLVNFTWGYRTLRHQVQDLSFL